MSRVNEHVRRMAEYEAAEETASALQDVNAIKMQTIRTRFDKNRAFFDEIRALYRVVQASAPAKPVPLHAGAERVLYVAVTANRRFAGTLTRETVDALIARMNTEPGASCIIIGRVGWQYFDEAGYAARGRQVLFAEDTPTAAEVARLLSLFTRFDRIFVWYPRFVNPFRQEVAVEDITQSPGTALSALPAQEESPLYLFEPEVSALLAFFDTQVRALLFERVLLESDLARTAARFVTMEEARDRAAVLVKKERVRLLRERATAADAELLETFAGFTRWRTN